jgi:hypothetical protein
VKTLDQRAGKDARRITSAIKMPQKARDAGIFGTLK